MDAGNRQDAGNGSAANALVNGPPPSSLSPLPIVCTEKSFSPAVKLITVCGATLIVGLTLWFFIATQRSVRQWHDWKRILKDQSRKEAVALAHELQKLSKSVTDPATDPRIKELLSALETRSPIADHPESFYFVLDGDGKVWAHGKAPHLGSNRGNSTRRNNNNNGDRPKFQRNDGQLNELLDVADQGGGFVTFAWKHDRRVLAYVRPVKGTDLVLGAGIQIADAPIISNQLSRTVGTARGAREMWRSTSYYPMAAFSPTTHVTLKGH